MAIASGFRSATADTAPGPTDDNTPAATKKTSGTTRGWPPDSLIVLLATRSSVPFASASANSSVTPVSVRKSDAGKPAITWSALHPAAYLPISHANAVASTPTLMRDVHDITMAVSSASRERTAGLIPAGEAATDVSAPCPERCVAEHSRGQTREAF